MAFTITDKCKACGICMEICPFDAITKDGKYIISAAICVSCGSCADQCPAEAIVEG